MQPAGFPCLLSPCGFPEDDIHLSAFSTVGSAGRGVRVECASKKAAAPQNALR